MCKVNSHEKKVKIIQLEVCVQTFDWECMYTNACECASSLACACHKGCNTLLLPPRLLAGRTVGLAGLCKALERLGSTPLVAAGPSPCLTGENCSQKDSNSANVCFYCEPCSLTEGSEAKRSNRYLFQSICTLFLTST